MTDTTKPVKPGIRERRRDETAKLVTRLADQREKAIAALVKLDGKLIDARRALRRCEKRIEDAMPPKVRGIGSVLVDPAPVEPPPYKPGASMAAIVDDALHGGGDDLEIPGFLKRAGSIGKMTPADLKAMAEIEAEKTDRRKAKSHGRIAKLKAEQSGETRQMPLTGKAALAKIRAG